jgi:uncharacterized sporulation protein YeaH/YhbH (DUF444 family)
VNQIIDRRLNGKNKSAVNRARFLRRYKDQIKKAVSDAVSGRSITDMERGDQVNIPAKDISEPVFHHGAGGRREVVQPGNKEFSTGDRVPRPDGGAGRGQKASQDGGGQDDFVFQLSREEFLQFFFDDLALPDLVKTQLAATPEHKTVRAGYTTSGTPANINVVRSLRGALARRIAMQSPYRAQLRAAEEQLEAEPPEQAPALEEEIRRLKRRIEAVPFIDSFDLRYNHRVKQPKPATQAVMFCLMDASASMTEPLKDLAKRFFMLLHVFLTRYYREVHLVFIRHTSTAMEVDEETFFRGTETGGTVISTALEEMLKVVKERYSPADWNIYAAQASDGDNFHDDMPRCLQLLDKEVLPICQYFAYVETTHGERFHDSHETPVWHGYNLVARRHKNFATRRVASPEDIYPVFHELFSASDQAA